MATDKSISIRQTKATEQVAADIAEIKAAIAELRRMVLEMQAALAATKPAAEGRRKGATNET